MKLTRAWFDPIVRSELQALSGLEVVLSQRSKLLTNMTDDNFVHRCHHFITLTEVLS